MKFILLLLLLFVFAQTRQPPPTFTAKNVPKTNQYVTRDDLLPCIKFAFEKDDNGQITLQDLEIALNKHISNFTQTHYLMKNDAAWAMQSCDGNKDGILNMTDWNEKSCLSYNLGAIGMVNEICKKIMAGEQY